MGTKPVYDLSIIDFAIHLGWKPESMFGDLGSMEALLLRYKEKFNCDLDTAVDMYRDLIMVEVTDYLEQIHKA